LLVFPEYFKFTINNNNSEVILYNLEKGGFLKIKRVAWDFLNEYLNSKGENIIKLNNEEKNNFYSFLNNLKNKKYLVEKNETKKLSNISPVMKAKRQFYKNQRTAYYEITHSCNLQCSFCYVKPTYTRHRIKGDFKLSKEIIDRAKEINVTKIILSGGEPLLRKDIFDIIRYSKKNMDKVYITTNGILIDKKIAQRLKNSGIDMVSVSIESSEEKIHDSLRGKGTFKKSIKALRNLKDAGFNKESLNITATINKKNISTLQKLIDFAEKIGVSMNYSFFQPIARGKINKDLAFTPEDYLKFVYKLVKVTKEKHKLKTNEFVKNNITQGKISNKMVPSIKNHCGMVEKLLGIKESGDLVPCHMFFSTNDSKVVIGNISEKSILEKMWNFYINTPTVDEKKGCKECNLRYFCGGACYAGGFFKDGNFYTPNPMCEGLKEYYRILIDCLGKDNESKCLYKNLENNFNF